MKYGGDGLGWWGVSMEKHGGWGVWAWGVRGVGEDEGHEMTKLTMTPVVWDHLGSVAALEG